MAITWDEFKYKNSNTRITFENMCRMLFKRFYFDCDVTLHSNPNNPGVEVVPVYSEKLSKTISFQAKFFEQTVDYQQIKESVKKVIKYYAKELDLLVVYSNIDINTTNKSYTSIKTILEESGIELEIVTNQEILDQVLDHPKIKDAYFSGLSINESWNSTYIKACIESLGDRHNSFNIETNTDECLSLFIHDKDGINLINSRKEKTIGELKDIVNDYPDQKEFIYACIQEVHSLNDISRENILECLNWEDTVKNNLQKYLDDISTIINELKHRLEEGKDIDKNDQDLWHYKKLVSVLDVLSVNDFEEKYLINKTLIISGDAGTGKTHILAEKANKLINDNHLVILLLGQNFITNDYITLQIPQVLGKNGTIDELLNSLEAYGENNECTIPIMIDAINESAYKEIWKQGLSSLICKIENYNYLKLVISYRKGYESFLIDDFVKNKLNKSICILNHYGFMDNSYEAIKKYLDYYNIPFSPSYLLDSEFTNPLFLKLFCKTYNGEEVDLQKLIERLLSIANVEVCNSIDLDPSRNYIKALLNELCIYFLNKKVKIISFQELMSLDFWGTYGLSNNKPSIINQLIKNGIINSFIRNEVEYCYLGYNILEDYLIGKVAISLYPSNDEIKDYIIHNILNIQKGKIQNHDFIGVFGACSNLFYEKFQNELVNEVIGICDNYSKEIIIEHFLEFYKLRKSNCINVDFFIEFVNNQQIDSETVFSIILSNALKTNNPLNAKFLHKKLLNKTLAIRDYIWTTYINMFTIEENRILYLIDLIAKGKVDNVVCQQNNHLMVVLFSWFLSSSNTVIRDTASRALIEILKRNFELCQYVLELFENVNDPYILQRLYAVVFGACTKRTNPWSEEYEKLTKYIYKTVFDKKYVYPDILLRDYAKLIIELYVHEYGIIDEINIEKKINPPYNSEPIPIIENSPYADYKEFNSGEYRIISSMHPDTIPGMYGDFGRYIFEYSLNEFKNVDVQNAYYYGLKYIFEDLGYSNELFGSYDSNMHGRLAIFNENKIERIGKKYQWIALFNILARLSDRNDIKEDYNAVKSHTYRGSFEPYVRFFDPTINPKLLSNPEIDEIKISHGITVAPFCESNEEDAVKLWLKENCEFFSNHSSDVSVKDAFDEEWIYLYQYKTLENQQFRDTKSHEYFKMGNQEIWKISQAYIVSNSSFKNMKEQLKDKNFFGRWFPENRECYILFNREYAWSSGFEYSGLDDELEVSVETDKYVKQQSDPLIISDVEGSVFFQKDSSIYKKPVLNYLGKVKQAYLCYLYESQNDGMLESTVTIYMPCKEIIDYFDLKQKEHDGYFYDGETIVAFDARLSDTGFGLLIKKEYLCKFLMENQKSIFWTNFGEKQYYFGERNQAREEWSGFSYISDGKIYGDMSPQE